jgi:hypothetical protein
LHDLIAVAQVADDDFFAFASRAEVLDVVQADDVGPGLGALAQDSTEAPPAPVNRMRLNGLVVSGCCFVFLS